MTDPYVLKYVPLDDQVTLAIDPDHIWHKDGLTLHVFVPQQRPGQIYGLVYGNYLDVVRVFRRFRDKDGAEIYEALIGAYVDYDEEAAKWLIDQAVNEMLAWKCESIQRLSFYRV